MTEDVGQPTGSGKGIFGCLGCLGAVILVLIVVPIALVGIGWMMLPRVMAPADTEWVMVEPDAERGQDVRESLQAQLGTEGRTTIELTEADLNQLLANAMAERFPDADGTPQARFRFDDDILYLDARIVVPEDAEGIPSRMRGEPTGIQLGLAPRALGDAVSLRVQEVRMGRIPLPVGFAMGLLAGTEAGAGIPFLDPESGELRLPLAQLGPMAQGMTLHDLSVRGGSLRLDVSR